MIRQQNIILLVCEKNIQEGAILKRGNPTKCLLQSFRAQRWVLLSRAVTIVKEMSFKCDLEVWKIRDLEIPYMFHVKMEKELGWQKFWLHLCSKKSFWSAWYWPIEFTTSVLYLSCLQFCYWNNCKKKAVALLRPPMPSQFASWPLRREMILRISFCKWLAAHTEMSCDTFKTINTAKCKRQGYLHTSVWQFWTRSPFTLKIHSSFQMILL